MIPQHRSVRTPWITIDEMLLPPHCAVPSHEHEPPHVLVVLDGVLTERHGAAIAATERSAIRYSPGGDRHDVEIGSEGLHCLVIGAPGFPELGLVDRVYIEAADAANEVSALQRTLFIDERASPAAVEAQALALFSLVRARARTLRVTHHRWLASVRDRLDTGDVPNAPLADAAHATQRHAGLVARQFRASHGVTVGRYTRRRQIDRAWALLGDATQSLGAVAVGAGFADQSHLTRVLVQETGATPAQLRRRMQHDVDGAHWFRAEPLRPFSGH